VELIDEKNRRSKISCNCPCNANDKIVKPLKTFLRRSYNSPFLQHCPFKDALHPFIFITSFETYLFSFVACPFLAETLAQRRRRKGSNNSGGTWPPIPSKLGTVCGLDINHALTFPAIGFQVHAAGPNHALQASSS
jgi:hypothetical protein